MEQFLNQWHDLERQPLDFSFAGIQRHIFKELVLLRKLNALGCEQLSGEELDIPQMIQKRKRALLKVKQRNEIWHKLLEETPPPPCPHE